VGERWQIHHKKGNGQNQYLLENSLYTDCEFAVGDIPNIKVCALYAFCFEM
jgi:hypothetical protein